MSFEKLKQLVFGRAKGLCEYCKSPANISSQPFVIEHITPKSKGGQTESENLALSCQGCNNHKYNKTKGIDKLTNKETDLHNPRKQEWVENFAWTDDVIEIIGKNSTGRVTVDELKLNRDELQNLRKLLAKVGKHPPK
ncbi:MAG: HNH endonuclease [Leptospiraceae bacterium]|nr:HNH endonuclease [Leptospiraceae bacterium]MCP5500318.1 HNH endonuclease [Leptospiraceae bacterium]